VSHSTDFLETTSNSQWLFIDRIKVLEGQAAYDRAVEFDNNLRDTPFDLLHETVNCRDKTTGEIVEYTVVDYITSALSGEYFVLEDGEGQTKQVTVQEFYEMRTD
jgi:hypothetical protein